MKDPRNISTKRIWFILIDIVVIFILCGFGLKSLCNLGEYNKYLLDSYRRRYRVFSYTAS